MGRKKGSTVISLYQKGKKGDIPLTLLCQPQSGSENGLRAVNPFRERKIQC